MLRKICFTLMLLMIFTSSSLISAATLYPEYSAVFKTTQGKKDFTQNFYCKDGADGIKMRVETKGDNGQLGTMIIRADQQKVWIVVDSQKIYFEQMYESEKWAQYQFTGAFFQKNAKSVGREKVLGYDCDIYQHVENKLTLKNWVARSFGGCLRTVITDAEGKTVFKMDAQKVKIEKQPDALFELPSGYEKKTMNLDLSGLAQ